MKIAPCDNETTHDEHNPTPTTWCPGANGVKKPPKPVWSVTIHSTGGSMGEAIDAQAAWAAYSEHDAKLLADTINGLLRKRGEDDMYYAVWVPLDEVTLVDPATSSPESVKALDDLIKAGKVPPGHLAVDVHKMVNDFLDDR